jgi:hypothetical protein
MCVNGKMRPTETIQEWGEGKKENSRGGKFQYDIFDVL